MKQIYVGDQIDGRVWYKISNQVNGPVWGQAVNQIDDQIWIQIWSLIKNQVIDLAISQFWRRYENQKWE